MTLSALRLTPSPPEQPLSICEQTRQWIRSVINLSDEAMKKLDREKITDLITGTFPEPGSQEVLQLTCDWTTLFCCLDDYLENFTDINELKAYLKELFDVYNGSKDASSITPFTIGMANIGRRIKELAPHLAAEFTARLTALFSAFMSEARYRITGSTPELEEYLAIREVTVGLRTGFILGLAIQNIDLPLEILEDDTIKAIERSTCIIVGLENDICTAEKELRNGEVNNAVIIFMQTRLSFEDAVAKVNGLRNENIAELERLIEEFSHNPHYEPEVQSKVMNYVEMVTAYIQSHNTWSERTGRYIMVCDVA